MIRWFKSSYSSGPDGDSCVEVALDWFKSSYSDGSDPGDCLEVALDQAPSLIHIRDSKQTGGAVLSVGPGTWAEFVGYAARR
ncbi:DUF397 domain-containing protein [Streptomyces sp. NPDC048514]|uniref:DUF397 domain-containing protein n=1 Tax=Streptomyces sp. NPDC048514 TaxID=3365564 RepID=UPI00371574FE